MHQITTRRTFSVKKQVMTEFRLGLGWDGISTLKYVLHQFNITSLDFEFAWEPRLW